MARKRKGDVIDGVILLDKSVGLTSNALLQKVKRLFNAQKAGHTGSLDPFATGILPICLGQATKLSQFLLEANKRYTFHAKLGETSTTGDVEGELTQIATTEITQNITIEQIQEVINGFIGQISQIPPMYSALKKDGQPLYKLAREGITVERKPRDITIFELNIISYQENILVCDVLCSKGTYIRTLAEDIGNKLKCGAYLQQLRRTGFAHYDISRAHTFVDLEQHNNPKTLLSKSEEMIKDFPQTTLTNEEVQKFQQGQEVSKAIEDYKWLKIFYNERFIGIAKSEGNQIKPKRLFVEKA
jgi:tRNA pseudouridine55 synthase